jgi:O-antigen ligase
LRPDPAKFPPTGLRPFAVAMAVLAIAQFIPLPPGLWSLLPGRDPVAGGFALLNQPLPWMTLSLSAWRSFASIVWWLPAVALFMAMSRSDAPSATAVARTVVAVAVLSIAIGAMQRAGSGIYFYRIVNFGMGTGFFANANHQASFLLCTLALWCGLRAAQGSRVRGGRMRISSAVFYGVALLLVIGVLLSNSLAGIGLLVPVAAASAILFWPTWRPSPALVIGGLGLVAAVVLTFAVAGSLENDFGANANQTGDSRRDYLVNGLAMLRDFAPFGSGLGTFQEVYHWYEDPGKVSTTFVNHAHNDLLELLTDTGVFGLAGLGLFLLWWGHRSWTLWLGRRANPFPLAATILMGAVLAHSLVDYPLRTAAISGLFAVALALMLGREPFKPQSARKSSPQAGLIEI